MWHYPLSKEKTYIRTGDENTTNFVIGVHLIATATIMFHSETSELTGENIYIYNLYASFQETSISQILGIYLSAALNTIFVTLSKFSTNRKNAFIPKKEKALKGWIQEKILFES